MLILGRRVNQQVIITTPKGERVVVVPIKVGKNATRLGIDAPKDFTVHRLEVQERIDAAV